MKVYRFVLGSFETNCYIVFDEPSGLAAVVDPALCTEELPAKLKELKIEQLKYILLTHGHFDHIMGVNPLLKLYPSAKVAISKADSICLSNSACALLDGNEMEEDPIRADLKLGDGDRLSFGSTEIEVLLTPGHTPGSAVYLMGNLMFSGDTLFCRTCGRTDLFRGKHEDILDSVLRLGKLKGDYIIYPGHGPASTLDTERKSNRFMRKIQWSSL